MIAGMVVHHDDGGGVELQGAPGNLAWIYWRVIDRSAMLYFVGDENVPAIEKQHAELLDRLVRHGAAQIVYQLVPGIENRPVADFLARQTRARRRERP